MQYYVELTCSRSGCSHDIPFMQNITTVEDMFVAFSWMLALDA